MQVFNELPALTDTLLAYKILKKRIGLVPTMGALHQGHLKLIEEAKGLCDIVVCSIYVNPTQFTNLEDLTKYPRTLESDLNLLTEHGCDIVFCPDDNIMYNNSGKINLSFGNIEQIMEGKFRKGHFGGVALVVSKLFNIVKPDYAFFGQKDIQQFAIIKLLVDNLMFDIELICVPIVREESGLAMSSRNRRLSQDGLNKASLLYESLTLAKSKLEDGESLENVRILVSERFRDGNVDLQYFNIVNKETLMEVENIEDSNEIALCIAGYVEGVRLIDNMLLN